MDQNSVFKKHLMDLANQSYRQNMYTYTGFLSLAEQNEFHLLEKELSFAGYRLFGGGEGCERVMAEFGSEKDFGYAGVFPIRILAVEPNAEKFAEELGHRDYLGAILNLGIDRSLIGDIVIRGKRAWVYCTDSIADFLCENLTKIRHTYVCCRVADGEVPELKPEFDECQLNVASERIDALAAALTNLSRGKVAELMREKKVFVNGRLMENPSYPVKPGETISIRGYGKVIYDGMLGETRKGRCRVQVRKYL